MRSKTILLVILFSAFVLSLGAINVDLHNILPIKANFHFLTKETQKQVTCLAENIYFEAGHESKEGKLAVAFVTINRVRSGNYADTICGVVQQKTNGKCQFSWYCDEKFTNKRLTVRETPLYNDIRELSTNIIMNYERLTDVTYGATFYHADYVNPLWKLNKVIQIGRHIFYKSDNDNINHNKGII